MADITPLGSSSQFRTNSARDTVWYDPPTALPSATKLVRLQGLALKTFFLPDTGSAFDWAEPRGVVAAAWQPNSTTDIVGVAATTDGGLTHLRFDTGAVAPDGWVHVLIGNTVKYTDPAPDIFAGTKGSPGYVQPGFLFQSPRGANALTVARKTGHGQLRLRVYPFTASNGDRWRSTTLRLCPNIVAVAFQGYDPIGDEDDRIATTLDTAGDVIFNNTGFGAGSGWLWAWKAS